MSALDFIFWTFNHDDGLNGKRENFTSVRTWTFDADKFTETMVTFTETMVKFIEPATAALQTNIVTFYVDLLHS